MKSELEQTPDIEAEAAAAELDSAKSAPDNAANKAVLPTESNPSGLFALCAVARFHQIAADPTNLAHQLGLAPSAEVTTDDLLRAAKHLGLKAKLSNTSAERLGLTPLPALVLRMVCTTSAANDVVSKLRMT